MNIFKATRNPITLILNKFTKLRIIKRSPIKSVHSQPMTLKLLKGRLRNSKYNKNE